MNVSEIFHLALQRTGSERADFLQDACDQATRAEVESLLAAHEQARTIVREPPRKLGRYRVLEKIGAGGMGEVYLAEDESLGRRVAIKVLTSELTANADRLARFRREARAIANLNHANIITIHDYGTEGDRHFFVTEYVAGGTLRDAMRNGVRTPDAAIAIVLPVAAALATAHEQSIVHRDIKPENIMITAEGRVTVVDFGIAKLLEVPATRRDQTITPTQLGTVMGTVAYMAPEQIRGESVDGRTDVFSLGVVLYEMLAGRRPFVGATAQDTMAAILTAEPPPLSVPAIDPVLGRLIESMLAKEREARPASADVLRELQALVAVPQTQLHRMPAAAKETAPLPNNLPADSAPLTGRDREVASIVSLLERPDVRLVTITGPAGTGKTRVAIAAGRAAPAGFSAGVRFVALEAVRDPGLVASSIADAIGGVEASLHDHLRTERVLLILDNFEQVMDAAPFVASLVSGTEFVKILVTSQAALHIRAEHQYPLDPLPLPSARAELDAVRANASVMMFADRARSVRPDFEVTVENANAVAEICRALAGLPLAIELAAVRVRTLSPSAILERLRDPLAFLTGGPRDLPERQRALRSAIEWSLALLDDRERHLFAMLAIFDGGWTAEACGEICGGDADEVLDALVDKSLVRRLPSPAEQRFGMLDAIRRVAESRLAASVDRASLADRHLDYFARYAEAAELHLVAAEQPFWVARLSAEHANLRAALRHAVDMCNAADGLKLATGLWKFWHVRGLYREGTEWLAKLLSQEAGIDPVLRWRAWYAHGVLSDAQGDYSAAHHSFTRQLAICRQVNDDWGIASAVNNVAIAALRLGKIDDSAIHHSEALRLWRALGNLPAVALSLQNLGNVHRARGAKDVARERYQESAGVFRSVNDQRGVAMSLTCLADLDRDDERFDSAIEQYEDALQAFMSLNDHQQVARCMADYGDACRAAGRIAEARSLLAESVMIFREVGDPRSGADVLERLAVVEAEQGDRDRALQLAAAATTVKQDLGAWAGELHPSIVRAKAEAGVEGEASWRRGATMSFDEAVDFAQPA